MNEENTNTVDQVDAQAEVVETTDTVAETPTEEVSSEAVA